MSDLDPSQLLDEWRLAKARLSERDPDAADFEDMQRESERLRQAFQGTAQAGPLADAIENVAAPNAWSRLPRGGFHDPDGLA